MAPEDPPDSWRRSVRVGMLLSLIEAATQTSPYNKCNYLVAHSFWATDAGVEPVSIPDLRHLSPARCASRRFRP